MKSMIPPAAIEAAARVISVYGDNLPAHEVAERSLAAALAASLILLERPKIVRRGFCRGARAHLDWRGRELWLLAATDRCNPYTAIDDTGRTWDLKRSMADQLHGSEG